MPFVTGFHFTMPTERHQSSYTRILSKHTFHSFWTSSMHASRPRWSRVRLADAYSCWARCVLIVAPRIPLKGLQMEDWACVSEIHPGPVPLIDRPGAPRIYLTVRRPVIVPQAGRACMLKFSGRHEGVTYMVTDVLHRRRIAWMDTCDTGGQLNLPPRTCPRWMES